MIWFCDIRTRKLCKVSESREFWRRYDALKKQMPFDLSYLYGVETDTLEYTPLPSPIIRNKLNNKEVYNTPCEKPCGMLIWLQNKLNLHIDKAKAKEDTREW